MNKITAEHLARRAVVYVRQSTVGQLQHNPESRRRQYGLVDRARQLGWADVEVVDDDLGRSGGGIARPGFERLLAMICRGEAGIVLSLEASRLARNGRDWHTLIEFCGLVGTLIGDEDGLYDPRAPNDRLLLGVKGTMSELELSLIRQRSQEALKLKSERGELFTTVAIGYARVDRNRIEKVADVRIQEAIALVFRKFAELQSIRQVHVWLRQESIEMPANVYGPTGWRVIWKPPIYNTVHRILTNPIYAGAYAYMRSTSTIRIEGGRKHVRRGIQRPMAEWAVLLRDHHEGYIPWPTFEHNRRVITDNANGRGDRVRGPARKGEALLGGLLRCGHCGRKLHVHYTGKGGDTARYGCRGAMVNHGIKPVCIGFGSIRVDRAIGEAVLRVIKPDGISAAIAAAERLDAQARESRRQIELALEQATYEVERTRRQYDAVDPANRLVAGELERRWNERLAEQRRLQERLAELEATPTHALSAEEHAQLMTLGARLDEAWFHPAARPETRKRILRSVLKEIVVRAEGRMLAFKLHWAGGDHTELEIVRNTSGKHRWATEASTMELIQSLARRMPDRQIAAILNGAGKRTAHGHSWTASRVRAFRGDHSIAVYQPGERAARGEISLDEAALRLGISKHRAWKMIHDDLLPAIQLCKGAPWIIKESDLGRVAVIAAATRRRRPSRSQDDAQQDLDLSSA